MSRYLVCLRCRACSAELPRCTCRGEHRCRAVASSRAAARTASYESSRVKRIPPGPEPIDADLTHEERVNIAVYENVNRSVVNINTKGARTDAFFFLDMPTEGMGSGSILDKSGHVLTNYHVIEGAKEIEVSLFNGESFAGQLVGSDPSSDLAVLKVGRRTDMLFPVTIGDSTRTEVAAGVCHRQSLWTGADPDDRNCLEP